MNNEERETLIHQTIQDHHMSIRGKLSQQIMGHPDVAAAVNAALAAGIPWQQILAVMLPIIINLISGGKVDWQAIITAILALITPTPAPKPALDLGASVGRP